MKICIKCKKSDPEVKFWKHSQAKDGLQFRCSECLSYKNYGKEWRSRNLNSQREYSKNLRWKWKIKFINAYGGKCLCCGESEPKFLTLDHINGGGKNHRKGRSSLAIMSELEKMKWPRDNFQLLCFNCNLSKGFFGSCPHKIKLEIAI